MVRIVDEGSHFDVPIDVVWKYVQDIEHHGLTHHGPYTQMKTLTENSTELSWDSEQRGNQVKVRTRVTSLPPLGVAIEILDGPMVGSKFFNIYSPKGEKTEITVIGDFASKTIPPAQLEPAARGFLDTVFNEDSAALKTFNSKK